MRFRSTVSMFRPLSVALCALLATGLCFEAGAQVSPYSQSVAIAAADQDAIATFYAARAYAPVWTGAEDADRRAALFAALARAEDHGLPVQRYDVQALAAAFRAARTEGDRGRLEVRMTRAYLDYVHDIHSGVLTPAKIDPGIVRDVPRIDPALALSVLTGGFGRISGKHRANRPGLCPIGQGAAAADGADGAWRLGPRGTGREISARATGAEVVALRDRLVAMGYLRQTATRDFDDTLRAAVQRFQSAHGLEPDGVVDEATLAEINVAPEQRMKSILVALERERWINIDRGHRHVWVNLTDFTARIIDDGKETFVTRSVIGKNVPDQRSPEFSDEMEYMVVNPSWSVPRSITTKEYLPLLKKNPNAAGHLKIVDSKGRVIDRSAINFGKYTAANFPFSMRQPPSDGNALGLVKFMFPNQWNIYLHDTPSKSLFDREVRAFSHGCIRLARPIEFGHALLAAQSDDPQGMFQKALDSGQEQALKLETHVPVHLVYFTAFPGAKGAMNYRRDVYGRDALIFDALLDAGVVTGGHQG
ncbi:murein L,D-transpeptidase [Gemmobacter lanyuensis]